MDFSLFLNVIYQQWWFLLIALMLGIFRIPWVKGLVGEAFVMMSAGFGLPKDTYHPFHNVTLKTLDGTTQIDHDFVSEFGIFVVETKNLQGWIFGREEQAYWTQKIYRKSSKFQNPLRQNFKHLKVLEALLDLPSDCFHSVVAFTGTCTFKTAMPPNITTGIGFIAYIKSFQAPVLSKAQVVSVVDQIEGGRLANSFETHRRHVQHLKSRADPNAERLCPQCGNRMILRTAKRGKKIGKRFWGCSAYPVCKMVQELG